MPPEVLYFHKNPLIYDLFFRLPEAAFLNDSSEVGEASVLMLRVPLEFYSLHFYCVHVECFLVVRPVPRGCRCVCLQALAPTALARSVSLRSIAALCLRSHALYDQGSSVDGGRDPEILGPLPQFFQVPFINIDAQFSQSLNSN